MTTLTTPKSYLEELAEEQLRVAGKFLAPKGLDTRHVLLVGGAGYIGTVVAAALLARGYRVRALDCFLYENEAVIYPLLAHPGFEFVYGDFAQSADLRAALEDISDVVILGSLVGDPITKKYPDEARAINHDGTLALLDTVAAMDIVRTVFVSTCSNYGLIPDNTLADEAFELSPLSLYAEAKVAAEKHLLEIAGNVNGNGENGAMTVLRFATAFGLSPRMRFDLTISEFTREMFLGRDLLVYDPDTWRPYCHVQDFAELIRVVLEAPVGRVAGEVFNAGGNVNNFTKRMVVEEIKKRLPDAPVAYQEHGEDPRNYRVDFTKVRERLYFEPSMTVPDGIDELITAMGQHLFDRVDARPNFYGNREIHYG